jgi:hypothetical protein
LIDLVEDYLDRGALDIKSAETVADLATLERDERGNVDTRGHDRAVSVMMTCIADFEAESVEEFMRRRPRMEDPEVVDAELVDLKPGIDEKLWREAKGLPPRNHKVKGLLPGVHKWTAQSTWEPEQL